MSPSRARAACLVALLLAGCAGSERRRCLEQSARREDAALETCRAAYAATGDAAAAIASARAAMQQKRFALVEPWTGRLAGRAEEAQAWELAGSARLATGDEAGAERCYRKAIAQYEQRGETARSGGVYYRLYYLAWNRARYREALGHATASFERAAGDRRTLGNAARGLYAVLYNIGDLEGAQLALETARAVDPPAAPVERAQLLNNQALVQLRKGRPALAARMFRDGLRALGAAEDRTLRRSLLLNLVETHLQQADLAGAAAMLQEAFEHAEPDGTRRTALLLYRARVELAGARAAEAARSVDEALATAPIPEWAWELHLLRGRAAEAAGRPREAADAYAHSAQLVDQMRAELGLDELKAWLSDRKRQPLESLFRLQAAAEPERALETAERVHARTHADAMLRLESHGTPLGQLRLEAVARQAEGRIELLRSLMPRLGAAGAAALPDAQRLLRATRGVCVISYLFADDRLWLLRALDGRLTVRPLETPALEVERRISAWLARLEDGAAAESLAGALLPPGVLPAAGTPLLFVADRRLKRVPFAALPVEARPLLERHATAVIPSLGSRIAPESGAREGARVLGDPGGDLPAAALEAAEVARTLNASLHTGSAATTAALQQAGNARLLHVASHGDCDARGCWLELADGRVTADAILRGRLAPRLVVLASCGSGVTGANPIAAPLASAFLAAGSRSVLASLWPVDDASTRELVRRFYAADGVARPMEALAQAQRGLLDEGRPARVWAAFALFGGGE